MAPDQSGSPKGEKKVSSTSRRDQPLFASRRPGSKLQQAPEFLTESLNTTFIPSPSPQKGSARQDLRPKPRQAWDRKSLAVSFNATSNRNKENESPQGRPKAEHGKGELHKRSPTTRTHGHTQSTPPVLSPGRTRTPSPARGRRNTFESPASNSSPPHGYAEAYQRIVEETDLADSIDDTDLGDFDYSPEVSLQPNRVQNQSRQPSRSPVSLRSSRKASPKSVTRLHGRSGVTEESFQNGDLKDTMSDPGALEEITESSIDSGSSQHARDLHRLNSVLNNGNRAFSKARLGGKTDLTAENLRRRNGSNESLRSSMSASTPSRNSDPSVNVPKAWGRRARPGKDWLNRINERNGRAAKGLLSPQSPSAEHEKMNGVLADDWTATASEIPLPDSSSIATESSQGSTPKTTVPRNTQFEPRRDWEIHDDEFTGRSLQVSESPPMQIRRTISGRLREEEIGELEKQAVTTSRLGELKEKVSNGTLRRKALGKVSPERVTEQPDVKNPPVTKDTDDSSVNEDFGEAVPNTPVVIYKNGSEKRSQSRSAQRPKSERQESHDLLKRLAKAASESPSSSEKGLHTNMESGKDEDLPKAEFTPQLSRVASRDWDKTPMVTGAWVDQTLLDSTPLPVQKNDLRTPKVSGAWVDTPLPAEPKGISAPGAREQQVMSSEEKKKPAAAETISKLSPQTSKKRTQEPALPYTGPPLPKSVLQGIIRDAKDGQPHRAVGETSSDSEDDVTLQIGNATLQSLEEFMETDTDRSTQPAPTPPSQDTSPPPSSSDPSPSTEKSLTKKLKVSDDPNTYSKLLSRLTDLGPSLRASRRQIASLERTVSGPRGGTDSDTGNSLEKKKANAVNSGCHEAGELHDFIWPCQHCGCPGGGRPDDDTSLALPSLLTIRNGLEASTTTVTVLIPRLWRWRQGDRRPRLTWVGAIALSLYAYFFFEYWAR